MFESVLRVVGVGMGLEGMWADRLGVGSVVVLSWGRWWASRDVTCIWGLFENRSVHFHSGVGTNRLNRAAAHLPVLDYISERCVVWVRPLSSSACLYHSYSLNGSSHKIWPPFPLSSIFSHRLHDSAHSLARLRCWKRRRRKE